MFTTAEDWFDRFKAAGGRMRIDAASMYLLSEKEMSATVEAIWNEIQGTENSAKWKLVDAYVHVVAGPFDGSKDL
jgi:hypothetical protein